MKIKISRPVATKNTPVGGYNVHGGQVKTVIYVDELVAVNLFVTYLLLLAALRLTGARAPLWRRLLGSAAGALVSLAVFIPYEGFFITLAVNAAGSLFITAAAFAPRAPKLFFKLYAAFFAVSFLFGGVMLAVCSVFSPGRVISRNGVVYFDVDVMLIAALTAVCYGLICIGEYVLRRRTPGGGVCEVEARRGERTLKCRALYDTGMSLSDVFSGRPAVITDLAHAGKLLTKEEYAFFEGGALSGTLPESLGGSFRVLTCSTVSGDGILTAFSADELICGGKSTKDVYIAVSKRVSGTGEYEMLIGGEINI